MNASSDTPGRKPPGTAAASSSDAATASSDAWTLGRLLAWTAEFLAKRGAENPRLDAEVLLAHVRGCQRIDLYTAFGEVAAEDLRGRFRELVRQRAEGVPVAYLVGRREFYSLSFRVTRDVLIPRPETEFAVLEALDRIAQRPADATAATTVADVGTGSGAIAVALAVQAPHCRITATDISPAALEVARQNAAEHGVAERIEFVESDLLAGVATDRHFDLIVSNPPYVAERELAGLSRDVRDHEPRLALVAGAEGTEVIARLIEQAAQRLVGQGWLIIEISPMIEAATRRLIDASGAFEPATIRKDLAGLPRIVISRRRP